jgi:hypothetical protein
MTSSVENLAKVNRVPPSLRACVKVIERSRLWSRWVQTPSSQLITQ